MKWTVEKERKELNFELLGWVDFTYIVEQFTGYVDFFLNRVNMLRLGWNLDGMLLGKIEQVMLKIGLYMLHVGYILHVTLKIGCYVLG